MKKKISLLGEILVDLVVSKDYSIRPCPGGSVFNTANTLAKLGVETKFFSRAGNDLWGRYLLDFMSRDGMDAAGITVSSRNKTPLAFAVCDEQGNAAYDFYKSDFREKIIFGDLSHTGIFHFGSFFSIIKENMRLIDGIFKASKKYGFLTGYDPNFRKGFGKYKTNMIKNFKRADIIKSSIDDIFSVFNTADLGESFEILENFDPALTIITLGSEGSAAKIRGKPAVKVPAKKVIVADTIGAGDNFTAGYLYMLHVNDIFDRDSLLSIDEDFIDKMLAFATLVAAESLQVKGSGIEKVKLTALKNLSFT